MSHYQLQGDVEEVIFDSSGNVAAATLVRPIQGNLEATMDQIKFLLVGAGIPLDTAELQVRRMHSSLMGELPTPAVTNPRLGFTDVQIEDLVEKSVAKQVASVERHFTEMRSILEAEMDSLRQQVAVMKTTPPTPVKNSLKSAMEPTATSRRKILSPKPELIPPQSPPLYNPPDSPPALSPRMHKTIAPIPPTAPVDHITCRWCGKFAKEEHQRWKCAFRCVFVHVFVF